MLWLQLGARVHAPTSRMPDRIAGEYALHLQCPWRISGATGLIVGYGDFLDSTELADVRLRRWITQHQESPLVVADVVVDDCGGFVLSLTNDFALEVFPDVAPPVVQSHESWRLLQPGKDAPHFVLSDTGATWE